MWFAVFAASSHKNCALTKHHQPLTASIFFGYWSYYTSQHISIFIEPIQFRSSKRPCNPSSLREGTNTKSCLVPPWMQSPMSTDKAFDLSNTIGIVMNCYCYQYLYLSTIPVLFLLLFLYSITTVYCSRHHWHPLKELQNWFLSKKRKAKHLCLMIVPWNHVPLFRIVWFRLQWKGACRTLSVAIAVIPTSDLSATTSSCFLLVRHVRFIKPERLIDLRNLHMQTTSSEAPSSPAALCGVSSANDPHDTLRQAAQKGREHTVGLATASDAANVVLRGNHAVQPVQCTRGQNHPQGCQWSHTDCKNLMNCVCVSQIFLHLTVALFPTLCWKISTQYTHHRANANAQEPGVVDVKRQQGTSKGQQLRKLPGGFPKTIQHLINQIAQDNPQDKAKRILKNINSGSAWVMNPLIHHSWWSILVGKISTILLVLDMLVSCFRSLQILIRVWKRCQTIASIRPLKTLFSKNVPVFLGLFTWPR